jgi:hypothetical protein
MGLALDIYQDILFHHMVMTKFICDHQNNDYSFLYQKICEVLCRQSWSNLNRRYFHLRKRRRCFTFLRIHDLRWHDICVPYLFFLLQNR